MLVLISYDVNTEDAEGRKRLRQIAKQCVNYGQRVQNSVFECLVDAAQCKKLQHKLCSLMNKEKDSLRFYYPGEITLQRLQKVRCKTCTVVELCIVQSCTKEILCRVAVPPHTGRAD